jgi:hypothetical protein
MKTELKVANPCLPSSQSELDRLLAEAMKQPGIADALKLTEASEQYVATLAGYETYFAWEESRSCFSSCGTAPLS